MAKIIIIGLFGFLYQEYIFPTDEGGKYSFSEVVEVDNISKEELYNKGLEFMTKVKVLNSKNNYLTQDWENKRLQNKGSFYVYKLGSLKKNIDGAVEYNIVLKLKNGKFLYTITNFRFNPYRRNRYGKFEPINGKYVALEKEVSSTNSKSWDKHCKIVFDKTQNLILNLKSTLKYDEDEKYQN